MYSGHPTRTTLGNSLRTMSYIAYALSLTYSYEFVEKAFYGQNDEICIYVAGDDVMICGLASVIY